MKTFPSKVDWNPVADDGMASSRRRIGEIELGRDIAEDCMDVQTVEEVPHGADDGLDVSRGGCAFGSHS